MSEVDLSQIRDIVIQHMGAPAEVSLEPALDAMLEIEPGDTPEGWFVLGTARYFFFLKRWQIDNPIYGDVLDRFYTNGVSSWTTEEYQIKTKEAVATWYNFDMPAVFVREVDEPKPKTTTKKTPARQRVKVSKVDDVPWETNDADATKPKADGLEQRMAKRIAKQRGG